MVAFQEILGKQQAEQFATSLDAVVSHLEARQRQIIAALQETSTTLEVFKRLSSSGSGQTVEPITLAAIAQLEQAVVPKLEAIAEPTVPKAEILPTVEALPAESPVEAEPESEIEAEPEPEPDVSEPQPKAKHTKTPKEASKTGKKINAKGNTKGRAAQKYATFHPRRSVLKEFEGKTLREAIRIILTRQPNEAFTINAVMDALYGTDITPESFKVAKSVVVVELSKGKLTKQWSSVPGQRGVYIFSTAAATAEQDD